jgi:hypothetical protein
MRKQCLCLLLLCFALSSMAQMPVLTIDGKPNNGVVLQSLQIDIKVCGTVARTSWQMVFKNTTSRILEGNLNFPLKEGLSVSRYALDINGKLREAVPVDRSKGTEVFETIERRRVDPGLLEKIDGNTFRTRIYPINAYSTRTVLIGYEEELPLNGNAGSLQYYLPLNMKDSIADFKMDIAVIQSATAPVFDSSLIKNLQFTNSSNIYTSSIHQTNFVANHALAFSIPKPMDAAEVMLQEFENKYYYLVNTRLQPNEKEKILPGVVGLLWDASLSAGNRNIENEMALLDAYFKKLGNATVQLTVFSNTIKHTGRYEIRNGQWEALQQQLASVQYDGATNLSKINLNNSKADEFILVSDGLQTAGNGTIQLSNKPVYCISSATAADFSNLKFISNTTGGVLINLQTTTIAAALKQLTVLPFRFLGIKKNDAVKENYPASQVVSGSSFAVAGIAADGIQELTLQFGYGNTVSVEKTIVIDAEKQLCENFDITKIFAQKKIAELDIRYNQNKQTIEQLGKQFGIVTRNTSLIVLETLNDYLQYQVEPPAELREEYNRITKQRGGEITYQKERDIQRSISMINNLKNWYGIKEEAIIKVVPVVSAPNAPVSVAPTNTRTVNNKTFTGKVTDKDGNPIPFASILFKGTRTGLSADTRGIFLIRGEHKKAIVISATGYSQWEMQLDSNRKNFTVTLERNQDLNEVVVTGYGTRKMARSVSGSVQTVEADRIVERQTADINTAFALQGKVAGIQLRGQSSNSNFKSTGSEIIVRGSNSISGTFSAEYNNMVQYQSGLLYVLDGKKVNHYDINTDSVRDVYIVPGNTAAGFFGTDGANGVMIVTTKKFSADENYKTMLNKLKIETPGMNTNELGFDVNSFDYLKAIKQTDKLNRYNKYLELRQYYSSKPTYFFDVATYLLKTGDKINGLTVLSNLAEMENGNYELYKMLGYKLKEAGEYEDELVAFKKVLELRSADPQSYRDCALAYEDMGNHQQALDMLYEGMTKSYSNEMNRIYNGIEEIFLTEINRIIALHKKELNIKAIDKGLIAAMPADIRVVMNWNKNNSDIDLWVTDPNMEKCYYSHKQSAIGGRMSNDFTQGFGPEQFMLKTGVKGTYRIQVNYYSDAQVTIAGPTTIMAEIYTHYGTANEEKKIITLQMQKGKQGEVFVGEVEL